MGNYTPDVWVVVEINYGPDKEPLRKVLAGWYGGYSNGDSWKLSSGITETKVEGDTYTFVNHSGSAYICNKSCQRMSSYTASIYEGFQRELKFIDNVTMRIVEYE